jgi:hypothetical protein
VLKDSKYIIYVEPPIYLPTDKKDEKRKYIDIVVVSGEKIVFAIELKYTPRGAPVSKHVAADLDKLSFIKSRRHNYEKVAVTIKRYLGPNRGEEKKYGVASGCVVVFAVVAMLEKFPEQANDFWRIHNPFFSEGSIWKGMRDFPKKRLLVCVALTSRESNIRTKLVSYGATLEKQE